MLIYYTIIFVCRVTNLFIECLNSQQWPQDWKRSVFIPIPKKGSAKECSHYCTIALISHASKVMLKILQPGFGNTWTMNFRCSSWFSERQRNQWSKYQHPLDHRKIKSSGKTSLPALLTMPKPLTVLITINCGQFWKSWEYQTTWPASWEICM